MSSSLKDLTDRSGFVFEGAVRRTDKSPALGVESGVEPSAHTATVEIRKIFKGAPALARFAGREVTVQLEEHEALGREEHAIFFTNGMHFGEGLVLREVGRLKGEGPLIEREVHEAMQEAHGNKIADRLNQAEMVVAGTVIETRPFEQPAARRGHISEHDPEWWECVIEVTSIEKGKGKTDKGKAVTQLIILFAHSKDIVWYQSPKFRKGDTGIFFMHRRDRRGKPVPAFVTDHPLDFHPATALEHIRALMKGAPE